jgi:cyclin-dependent kinase 2
MESSIERINLGRFSEIEKIGEGTYGTVYRAIDSSTKKTVAIKKIRCHEENCGISPTSMREIAILKELNHQNVVKLYDAFNENKRLYLVFEYCDLDLKQLMDKMHNFGLNIQLRKHYLYQIVVGITYCHQRGVLHRDLKPENLLIDQLQNIIKVADFGLARILSIPLSYYTDEVVTLWYRAPEILLGMRNYETPVDLWSIGCIFAEMIIGKPLFPGTSEIDQLYKIFYMLGTPTEIIWPNVTHLQDFSDSFPKWSKNRLRDCMPEIEDVEFDIISRMLEFDPLKRITARNALKHPIFTQT